jgi:type IV secretion system protein TrbF
MSTTTNALASPAAICPSGQNVSTPFLLAKQSFDAQVGQAIAQKANWQRIALALTVAVVALAGTTVFLAKNVTVKAYVVEVAETGQIRTVGILPQTWQGQNLAPLEFVVRQWLIWTRSISTDPVVFAQHWDQAKDFMTQACWMRLREHIQTQHTRMERGETAQVTFGSLLPVSGHARSFAVEWKEDWYTQQGLLDHSTQWHAILKIAIMPPTDIANIKDLRNTLGIFIEEVQWTERVTDRKG